MALPATPPPGVDPYAYLNWLAQIQSQQQSSSSQQGLRQLDLVMELLRQSQDRYANARQGNENRYLDILAGLGISRDRYLGGIANYGASERSDLKRNYDTDLKNRISSLSDRGLSGTTISSSEKNQNTRMREAAEGRLDDRLLGMRLGADERMSNRIFDFMERKTDAYPDPVNGFLGQAGAAGGFLGISGGSDGAALAPTRVGVRGGAATRGGGASRVQRPSVPTAPVGGLGIGTGIAAAGRPNVRSQLRAMPVLKAPAAASAPQPYLPNNAAFDPAELQQRIIRMGGDPFASNANTLILNSGAGTQNGFNRPGALGLTQAIQGWQNAGNAVPGIPQFGAPSLPLAMPDYPQISDYGPPNRPGYVRPGYGRPRPRPRPGYSQYVQSAAAGAMPTGYIGDINSGSFSSFA